MDPDQDDTDMITKVYSYVLTYVMVKTPPQMLYKNIAQGVYVKRQMQHKAKPECCISLETCLKCCIFIPISTRWHFNCYVAFCYSRGTGQWACGVL